MTNGTAAPSAIHGDTWQYPTWGGIPFAVAIPWGGSVNSYTDLPPYWSWRRDVMLAASIHKEDMWSAAVNRTATKFSAHSFTIKDSEDSKQRVNASQRLFKQANGGEGWVLFATKLIQDLLTTDNGVFIRVRRADDETIKMRVKAAGMEDQSFDEVSVTRSSPGAKITGLYHLDSLRCYRTGNLQYPVRYQPIHGVAQLLRWDQVLFYADQSSPRADLFGVGFCAASRAYKTICTLANLRQLLHEFISGSGATKLAMIQGAQSNTIDNMVASGEAGARAKGFVHYLGTILGGIPSDTPISVVEILLKQLPQGFDPKQIIDDSYLIYADNIGIPVQDLQPLSGQGLGTGTQTVILQEAAQGIGALPAFLKWWEQTVSDRVLPATTDISFDNEHDLRDQKAQADVRSQRATERATRITSGEITPAIARQLAADSDDLPQELLAADATPGGQINDDEKPLNVDKPTMAALDLMDTLNTEQQPAMALASAGKSYDALFAAELDIARRLAKWSEQE